MSLGSSWENVAGKGLAALPNLLRKLGRGQFALEKHKYAQGNEHRGKHWANHPHKNHHRDTRRNQYEKDGPQREQKGAGNCPKDSRESVIPNRPKPLHREQSSLGSVINNSPPRSEKGLHQLLHRKEVQRECNKISSDFKRSSERCPVMPGDIGRKHANLSCERQRAADKLRTRQTFRPRPSTPRRASVSTQWQQALGMVENLGG